MAIDTLQLKSTTPIVFRHPEIDEPLTIYTGINNISWSYNLNTNVQSTYGGEVVQILSAFVDAITISGSTQDNRQLRLIGDWFLHYMQLAGLYNRDEHFVTMEYPERGWSLWLQPTQLPNFHYNRDEIGVEWEIQAEIVADNDLNYLSQMTMSNYTETAFDPSMFDMKFMEHDPRNDPIHLNPALGLKIGDNYQSLLGAWASGDFAHLAFDATGNVSKNNLKQSQEYWTQLFGTDSPFGTPSNNPKSGLVPLSNSVGGTSSALSAPQNAFAQGLAAGTGLNFAVVASWVALENNGSGRNNWLNVTNVQGQFENFSSVDAAVKATVAFLTTADKGGFYKDIINSAGKSDNAQIQAIIKDANAHFDRGGTYSTSLPAIYNRIKKTITAGGSAKAQLAVKYALSQQGVPYHLGAESPGIGFDCSGLCQWAYSKAGVAIPRTTFTQFPAGTPVQLANILPGDLVFVAGSDGTVSNPGHVVMYAGGGQIIGAEHTGTVVGTMPLSAFTGPGSGFAGIRRYA